MPHNRGKQFETVIRKAFEAVDGVSIDRLHDQLTGLKGSSNICDFIVYKKPYEYYIECKSVHGNRLSIHSPDPKRKYGNILNNQWEGLLDKSKINGVYAGILCWWVDKDVTKFLPIQMLENMYNLGMKSIIWDEPDPRVITIQGRKKRVFFDYDMDLFFHEIEKEGKKWMN